MQKENQVKKVTIYDIAKIAKTSATTVSRVLNGSDYPVKAELSERISAIAKELGYVPNMLARNLRSNNNYEIGMVIPNISNLFYPGVILAIEKYISQHGYSLILCNTFRDAQKERKCMKSLYEKQVRGVILSAVSNENVEEYRRYIKNGMEILLIDQQIPKLKCANIQINVFKGAELAIDYLVECGHRKIAFISTRFTRWTRMETFRGYKYALAKHGIPYNESYTLVSNYNEDDTVEEGFEFLAGADLANQFVTKNIDATAVLAVNDMVAFGFIQTARSFNISVPDDVSVVGFDDVSYSKTFSPALTTVKSPLDTIGTLAGNLIIERFNNPGIDAASVDVMPSLIVRDSVKKLK